MKTISVPTERLFQDRPLPESPVRTPRYTLPALAGFEYNDPFESLLRLVLVLCVLISLALCVRQWTAPNVPTAAGYAVTSAPLVEPNALPLANQPLGPGRRVVHPGV